jgi:predicted metal-dependent phosphotriesterase family hydrolase
VFVRTVTGDIQPKKLGFTHCHEHLFTYRVDGVDLPERLIIDSCSRTRQEVRAFRRAGGRAIVDAQPFGAGRNARFLRRLSKATNVNVIGSTGFHKTYFYPKDFWSYTASAEDIAGLFISEIEQGMYEYDSADPFKSRSDARAGVIKIATGEEGLSPYYEKVFEAASLAHHATGAPILTHTELSSFGLEQVRYLTGRGVPSGSIIVSHMDRVIDIEKNARLAALGVFLEYDTIARYKYHSDEDELFLIKEMVSRGFENRILLGLDVTRDRMKSYGGEVGLDYLMTTFLPMLQGAGISRRHVERFTLDNPKEALSFINVLKEASHG